jgi:phage terminase small subunit
MGRRGKAPMPTAMRKKLGIREKSKQKKRLRRGAEPQPREIVDTTAPSSLQYDADAVQCWNQLAPLLKELRLFTEGDTLPLEGLCRAYSLLPSPQGRVGGQAAAPRGAWQKFAHARHLRLEARDGFYATLPHRVLKKCRARTGRAKSAARVGNYPDMIADNEPGAEVYSTATKEDQAKIVWSAAMRDGQAVARASQVGQDRCRSRSTASG